MAWHQKGSVRRPFSYWVDTESSGPLRVKGPMSERVTSNPRTAREGETLIPARTGKRLRLDRIHVTADKATEVNLRNSVTGDVLATIWTRPSGGSHMHSTEAKPLTRPGEGVSIDVVDDADVRVALDFEEEGSR